MSELPSTAFLIAYEQGKNLIWLHKPHGSFLSRSSSVNFMESDHSRSSCHYSSCFEARKNEFRTDPCGATGSSLSMECIAS